MRNNRVDKEKTLNLLIDYFNGKINKWSRKYFKENISFVSNIKLNNTNWNKIKFIIIGDNPGKEESKNNLYLVGKAGMIARSFFEAYLVDDFNEEVLVLNKTPIFSKQTGGLKSLYSDYEKILIKTQRLMAHLTYRIHSELKKTLFIMGFSSYKKNTKKGWKLDNRDNRRELVYYFAELKEIYSKLAIEELKDLVYFINHFSGGQFFLDFKYKDLYENKLDNLLEIGKRNKSDFFEFDI